MDESTDYGRPMKPFFIKIPNFLAWAVNEEDFDICYDIIGQWSVYLKKSKSVIFGNPQIFLKIDM